MVGMTYHTDTACRRCWNALTAVCSAVNPAALPPLPTPRCPLCQTQGPPVHTGPHFLEPGNTVAPSAVSGEPDIAHECAHPNVDLGPDARGSTKGWGIRRAMTTAPNQVTPNSQIYGRTHQCLSIIHATAPRWSVPHSTAGCIPLGLLQPAPWSCHPGADAGIYPSVRACMHTARSASAATRLSAYMMPGRCEAVDR